MELYWTIVAALFAGAWTVLSMVRERNRQAIENARELVNRLLALDQISIEHPEIIMYLSSTALVKPKYFRKKKRLREELFFRSKSFIYTHLNLFDEILSCSKHANARFPFIGSPALIELEAWESYMRHVMTHPLCRSILKIEIENFGNALQEFWNKHKNNGIYRLKKPDPFSW